MARQFGGEKCALCLERPSSPDGEHVFPRWFLKMFPEEEGPYTWYVNGEPVLTRDGSPRSHTSIGAVKLPMCQWCNGILDKRFEKRAKALLRSLMATSGNVSFTPAEGTTLGLWFLKTWLLLAHPAARDSEPGIAPHRWGSMEEGLFGWMIDDGPPPTGLSLWVFKRGEQLHEPPSTRRVALPTVVADGHEIEFRAMRAGVRFLDVSLVYHPDWKIEHPLEVEGRALRLWPPNPGRGVVDFSPLPEVDSREFAWLKGPRLQFAAGAFGRVDLPALSSSFNPLEAVPGVEMGAW